MHPRDAAARGIVDGALVRLFNERGAARVTVSLTDDLMPGVVSLPEGIWVELDAMESIPAAPATCSPAQPAPPPAPPASCMPSASKSSHA